MNITTRAALAGCAALSISLAGAIGSASAGPAGPDPDVSELTVLAEDSGGTGDRTIVWIDTGDAETGEMCAELADEAADAPLGLVAADAVLLANTFGCDMAIVE